MTNLQLYIAIGVPILVGMAFNGTVILLLQLSLNRRFDDMRDLWQAELRRVEEVLDARLKHIEERVR